MNDTPDENKKPLAWITGAGGLIGSHIVTRRCGACAGLAGSRA